MPSDSGPSETPLALAGGAVADTGSPVGEAAVTLPATESPLSLPRLRRSLPRVRVRPGRISGRIALATLLISTFAIVATAVAGPSILVPRSVQIFPSWEAGPLHPLFPRLILNPDTLGNLFTVVLAVMFIAYLVVLGALRTISMRMLAIVVVALHAILLFSPPLQLTDVFNYLGYARLGVLHDLNPYTHVIRQEMFDPVYRLSSWHGLRSPYGPLFTALSYPLGWLPLPAAYWLLKLATVAMSLAFVWLVYHCARSLGRDPRFAVAFVALNPIFLVYEVAGFHNDPFMLVPSMAAIAFVIGRRDRSAGAALMVAVAVKFTAVLLLPFLLIAAKSFDRRKRVLTGALIAVPFLAVGSIALFGFSLPNLSQQSSLLTQFSIPNMTGLVLGLGGGTPTVLRIAIVGVVLVVAYQFQRNPDWISGAGWSTLALIASLSWLVPWYVVWLLPLAALSRAIWLRRIALVLTAFLMFAFAPATQVYMQQHGIDLLKTQAGATSRTLQLKLAR